MKKLFWKIIKWAVDKFLQKKIDGDKPKKPAKPERTYIDPGTGGRLGRNKKTKP